MTTVDYRNIDPQCYYHVKNKRYENYVIYLVLCACACGSVELNGGRGRRQVRCLSCSLGGASCQYVNAVFSRSSSYYVLGCLGPSLPTYRLRGTISDTGKYTTSVVHRYNKKCTGWHIKTRNLVCEVHWRQFAGRKLRVLWYPSFLVLCTPPVSGPWIQLNMGGVSAETEIALMHLAVNLAFIDSKNNFWYLQETVDRI